MIKRIFKRTKKEIKDFGLMWGGWKSILCMYLTALSVSYVVCLLYYLLE